MKKLLCCLLALCVAIPAIGGAMGKKGAYGQKTKAAADAEHTKKKVAAGKKKSVAAMSEAERAQLKVKKERVAKHTKARKERVAKRSKMAAVTPAVAGQPLASHTIKNMSDDTVIVAAECPMTNGTVAAVVIEPGTSETIKCSSLYGLVAYQDPEDEVELDGLTQDSQWVIRADEHGTYIESPEGPVTAVAAEAPSMPKAEAPKPAADVAPKSAGDEALVF